jgi:hypothetical protein
MQWINKKWPGDGLGRQILTDRPLKIAIILQGAK